MSAEKKKHDFHLVDPSPWPIYVSFATLVLAVGAVYYFHSKALWLLLVGFGGFIFLLIPSVTAADNKEKVK